MIVQLLGGIFDGAETEVRGDEDRIAILIMGTNRYALYTRSQTRKYRYEYQRTTREGDSTKLKHENPNTKKRK